MYPSFLAWKRLVEAFANARPATVITSRPGRMNERYETPLTCWSRSPSAPPKIARKSTAVATAGRIV
jgi:hypothetical protein